MNILDLILSIFLLLGLVRGLFKGFFVELSGLLALFAGIYASIHFSDITLNLLAAIFNWNENVLALVSFAATFFIVALLISLAAKILTKMASLIALGLVNRILGGLFGLLKMAFLASLFLMFLVNFNLFQVEKETEESSILYGPVQAFAPLFLPTILAEVKKEEIFKTPEEEKTDSTDQSTSR